MPCLPSSLPRSPVCLIFQAACLCEPLQLIGLSVEHVIYLRGQRQQRRCLEGGTGDYPGERQEGGGGMGGFIPLP